jgi:uncharacterized protein (TIGR03118 family)
MNTKLVRSEGTLIAGLLALSVWPSLLTAAPSTSPGFVQVNLVSDLAHQASHQDANLVNPWGLVAGTDEVVWVNDNGSGLITAYGPGGQSFSFTIHVPAPDGKSPGTPTGLVFNPSDQFVVTSGTKHGAARFLLSTEDGTIVAWNRDVTGADTAVIVADNSKAGAVYKGLAIAHDASGAPLIFAANFHAGMIDVIDAQFKPGKSFTDTTLPAGFAPFGIRNVEGYLVVTFAKQKLPDKHDDDAGPGNGYVDIFDTDGTLLRRFASQGALNSPWGLAVTPGGFGPFSHALLVGNFGDGKVNAYDLLTGKLLGHLTNTDGSDLVISGLWGLTFGAGHGGEDGAAPRLYFTAGLNDEADGLFGYIHSTATPKPHDD